MTEDKTRNKCIELVYDSLAMDSGAESKLILKRAIEIEAATYRNLKDPAQYRTKMRSLYLNLKDKSNPELRAGVISGEMDGTLLWNMSPQDMASAEKKAELAAMTKEALLNAQGAAPKKSETDMFECGKCRKRRCTYYQMQTRSADEVSSMSRRCVSLPCSPRPLRDLALLICCGDTITAYDDLRYLPRVWQQLAGECLATVIALWFNLLRQ